MIWIISIIMLGAAILGGFFIGYTPALHELVESDFIRRAYDNAYLEGIQYGDLALRAKTVAPSTTKDITFQIPNTPENAPIELMRINGKTQKSLECKITIPKISAAKPTPEIRVTVTKK